MVPVIVLGSRNSGSSAIVDYLRGRSDAVDPLKGQEFRLIQERGGLSSLHRSLSSEFHPDDAMCAVIEFAKLADRLGASSRKIRIPPKLGYGFSKRIPHYEPAIAEFLSEITACSFRTVILQDLLRFSTGDWIRRKFGRMPRSRSIVQIKPVPVTESEFMRCSRRLISRLFYEDPAYSKKAVMVFDQAGSFWSPISSTEYFGDPRKVILVSRDPCNVYASWQMKNQINSSAEEFARFHRSLRTHISRKEWSDQRVLHIAFENFVLNHDRERERLCSHLGISSDIPSTYDPNMSRKSVGRREKLKEEEINIIRSVAPQPSDPWTEGQ